MIQIGLSITGLAKAAAAGGETGGNPPPPPPAVVFYPAVPAVDLAAAGGSLRFPEGNWNAQAARPGLETWKGLLLQSRTGLTFAAGGTVQASFAIVRLPVDKRDGQYAKGIFGHAGTGGNRLRLAYGNPNSGTPANRNRFMGYQGGSGGSLVNILSAPWTEDAALVVLWHDGTDKWQLDWYSLKDGARYEGAPAAVAGVTASGGAMTGFNIGGLGATASFAANANPTNDQLWDGEIAAVGHVAGAAVTPAQWSQIALGARLQDILPAEAVKWLREFDGTAASLARPAWATADATPAAAIVGSGAAGVPGSTLTPGSTLRRQAGGAHVAIRAPSAGMVHGLTRGQTQRSVPFGGPSSGPVELRVYEAATGRVVRDWTAMSSYANGAWSGTLLLPESTEGWLFADARLAAAPSVIARHRSEFAVGYKFMIMGQSQTDFAMTLSTTKLQTITAPMSASVANQMVVTRDKATAGAGSRRAVMGRIGMGVGDASGDGVVAFLNQFRRLKPKTPFMLIDEATGGTSMEDLLDGTYHDTTNRHWSDLTDKLDLWGRDVTAVLWNWLMNEGVFSGQDVPRLMTAMFLPAGLGAKPHSLVSELSPGWTLGVLAGDRESLIEGREGMRAARQQFAYDNGFTLGPAVADYRIDDLGGPHPPTQFVAPGGAGYGAEATFLNGGARFMQRMAVMALQTIGGLADAAVHPYYANARFSADRTKILVDVIAVNGGAISAPAPAALRSWYVREPADGAYATTLAKGASAVLNSAVTPPRVEITRASGAWPAGTAVQRMDDGEKRAANDGAAEDAIHAGGLYEAWAQDPLGFGFPVVGSRDAQGRWKSGFAVTVAAP